MLKIFPVYSAQLESSSSYSHLYDHVIILNLFFIKCWLKNAGYRRTELWPKGPCKSCVAVYLSHNHV